MNRNGTIEWNRYLAFNVWGWLPLCANAHFIFLSFITAQFGLIRLSCTHSFLFLFILCNIRLLFSEWRVVSIFLLSFLLRTCVSASLWFHFQIPFWSAVPNKVNKCIQPSDATRFASYFFFLDNPCPCLYLRYNCTIFFRLFFEYFKIRRNGPVWAWGFCTRDKRHHSTSFGAIHRLIHIRIFQNGARSITARVYLDDNTSIIQTQKVGLNSTSKIIIIIDVNADMTDTDKQYDETRSCGNGSKMVFKYLSVKTSHMEFHMHILVSSGALFLKTWLIIHKIRYASVYVHYAPMQNVE